MANVSGDGFAHNASTTASATTSALSGFSTNAPDLFVHERPYAYKRPVSAYTLVSSFYGIGATIGWLLTVASCLCSWCFDGKKRRSGAITPDFIAVLTFPAVAAVHLMAQTRAPPKPVDDPQLADQILNNFRDFGLTTSKGIEIGPLTLSVTDARLVAPIIAIEASLNIAETFIGICIVMLLITVRSRCFWRSVMLAVVGLLCFAAETHLYLSSAFTWNLSRINLSRLFLVSFPGLLLFADLLLFVFFPPSLCVVALFWLRRTSSTGSAEDAPGGTPRGRRPPWRNFASRMVYRLPAGTLAATMFGWLLASLYPLTTCTVGFGRYAQAASLPPRDILRRFFANLVPRTATSIWDLDQAVAVLAGLTVLAFNVYKAVMPQLRKWRAHRKTMRDQHAYELQRLSHIRGNGAR